MKVLHIETGLHLYGGALQVCYLLEGLAARDVENVLVCRDRALAQAMGAAGRNLALREFAVDTMVEQYFNLYCDLLHRPVAAQAQKQLCV